MIVFEVVVSSLGRTCWRSSNWALAAPEPSGLQGVDQKFRLQEGWWLAALCPGFHVHGIIFILKRVVVEGEGSTWDGQEEVPEGDPELLCHCHPPVEGRRRRDHGLPGGQYPRSSRARGGSPKAPFFPKGRKLGQEYHSRRSPTLAAGKQGLRFLQLGFGQKGALDQFTGPPSPQHQPAADKRQ